jgi:hypothetical protein
MKTKGLSTLAAVMIISGISALACQVPPQTPPQKDKSVVVITTRMDIFYFKVNKEMMGGLIEIFDDKDEIMASQSITQKKMLLDFIDAKPGTYNIRISNGHTVREFEFKKEGIKGDIKITESTGTDKSVGRLRAKAK